MAIEPMTLFARIADPAGVARRLRELVPTVHIDGPDDQWRNAVVTLGRWWKKTLTLTNDPAWHEEPNWSTQMSGMQGHLARFRNTDRKERALMLPSTLRFSLGILFDPDCDRPDDPRLEIVYAIAELLDGVLFTPSSLRDARGRILFGAGGEDAEDPEAVWPKVIFEFSLSGAHSASGREESEPGPPDDEPDEFSPPTAKQVAWRALALVAVTSRAILEQDAANRVRGVAASYQKLLEWVRDIGIDDEFEPDEWKVLQRPPGKLDERMQIDSTWRLEGLLVLAWALGRFQVPPHDRLVEASPLWDSLGWLDVDAAHGLLADPTLAPRQEIGALRNRLFALHWRLADYRVRASAMDFPDFARDCGFGLDITGLPLINGDLALGGKRIDRATPDVLECASSAARERHQAVNWLWEGAERYSEVRTDT